MKKKGLVFIRTDLKKHIGVYHKVLEISKTLSLKGNVILVYNFGGKIIFSEYCENKLVYKRKINNVNIIKVIEDLLKKNKFEFAYIRFSLGDPISLIIQKILNKNKVKIFLEIPVFPFDKEIISLKNKIRWYLNSLFFKSEIFLSDYIVSTSYNVDNIFGKPIIRIFNGIHPEKFRLKKKQKLERDFYLIGVSSLTFWQGYDRVIKGIYDFKKKNETYNVKFFIIGEGHERKKLEKMVKKLGLIDNVEFLGVLKGEKLDAFFDMAHIAVGALGRHRTNSNNISTLKASEYCARGIPFFTSVNEIAFSEDFKFMKRIESNDENIDIFEIIDFYKYCENFDYPLEMRQFAMKELSWQKGLKNVLDLI
ncbi:glycosyl transferase, group 1 family protein [Thermosipho africanus Ob7]|uniref:Glycosyl transferase, group 1 family protein n=1 Tax=Thermosipho africanus (strain TCF52B) TaxID=484019 RepID=B7IGY0_THEAB|nr:glycosyltransferase [Thermosipho africanus]ACJ75344.1 glycosyl transferase, group 1 family protein [Thermosipho africanus TCF52B]RDI90812.1 glycosyl transferase, group 1 family protein [Thermosipho africanus Ob7]